MALNVISNKRFSTYGKPVNVKTLDIVDTGDNPIHVLGKLAYGKVYGSKYFLNKPYGILTFYPNYYDKYGTPYKVTSKLLCISVYNGMVNIITDDNDISLDPSDFRGTPSEEKVISEILSGIPNLTFISQKAKEYKLLPPRLVLFDYIN